MRLGTLNIPLHGYQWTVNRRLVPFPKLVEFPPSLIWYQRFHAQTWPTKPKPSNKNSPRHHTEKWTPTEKECVGCLTFGYGKDNPCKRRLFFYFCLHEIITTTILHRSTPQQQHWQSKQITTKKKNMKWKRTLLLSSSLTLLTHFILLSSLKCALPN